MRDSPFVPDNPPEWRAHVMVLLELTRISTTSTILPEKIEELPEARETVVLWVIDTYRLSMKKTRRFVLPSRTNRCLTRGRAAGAAYAARRSPRFTRIHRPSGTRPTGARRLRHDRSARDRDSRRASPLHRGGVCHARSPRSQGIRQFHRPRADGNSRWPRQAALSNRSQGPSSPQDLRRCDSVDERRPQGPLGERVMIDSRLADWVLACAVPTSGHHMPARRAGVVTRAIVYALDAVDRAR